jgi:hypothetical protein
MCIYNLRGFSHDQIGSSAQITGEKWSKDRQAGIIPRQPQGARPGRVSRYSFEERTRRRAISKAIAAT